MGVFGGGLLRVGLGVMLAIVFFTSIVWIVLGWPLQFRLWFALAVFAGGSLVLFLRFVRRRQSEEPWKEPLVAGVTCTTVLAALVAVPALQRQSDVGSSEPVVTSPSLSSSSPSPTPTSHEFAIKAKSDEGGYPPSSADSQTGPLIISAVHIIDNPCSGSPGWRIPLAPSQLGVAPVPYSETLSMPQWAKQHGGLEVSGTRLELTLQGKTDGAVVIQGIQINLIDKAAPSEGTHVIGYGECGGNGDTQYLVAKLDDLPPQVYEGRSEVVNDVEVVRKKSSRSLSAKVFHVSKSDPQRFILVAYGSKYDYSWELVIRWLSPDGEENTTKVRNEDGEPLSTAARLSTTAYISVPIGDEEARWQKVTQPLVE